MADPALTIPHLALAAADHWPEAEAIVDGDRRISFAELAAAMRRAAAAFVAAGLREGERVVLWAENGADWIVACLGLQAAGGVLVPLNTRYKAIEASDIVRRSGATLAVGSSGFLGNSYVDMLREIEAPALRGVIDLSAGWQTFLGTGEGHESEADRRLAALRPDDLGDILFTSGTTGAPKGVMATHEQTVRTARLWAGATRIGEGDRFMILWPFFHCSGYKAGWVVDLAVGATTLPIAQLDVDALTRLVAAERVTFLPGPPTLFQTLLAEPSFDPAALASVRVSITGAASVPAQLIADMRETLGIPVVLTGYGLTEACGTVTMTGPGDPPERIVSSCGRAIDGVELKVVDDAGALRPAGQPGHVHVRGYNVMLGYLDDPAATAAIVDADGWLDTGDIGMVDTEGYLTITDRSKDMFITGGFNCYPAEIEELLLAHPAVHEVAVKGVPDDRMGEVGAAWIVLADVPPPTAAELIGWARERMANFKVPRTVRYVSALPRNATGKVQKFLLDADVPAAA